MSSRLELVGCGRRATAETARPSGLAGSRYAAKGRRSAPLEGASRHGKPLRGWGIRFAETVTMFGADRGLCEHTHHAHTRTLVA